MARATFADGYGERGEEKGYKAQDDGGLVEVLAIWLFGIRLGGRGLLFPFSKEARHGQVWYWRFVLVDSWISVTNKNSVGSRMQPGKDEELMDFDRYIPASIIHLNTCGF